MKKTLTAICFAMAATFAFAQTSNTIRKADKMAVPAIKFDASAAGQQASYKGSVFTKAEGDTLLRNEFTTQPTTGTLSASDVVNDSVMGSLLGHSQTCYGATWHLIADTSISSLNQQQWPVSYGNYSDAGHLPFYSNTADNGLMMMAMQEQIQAWGGTGATGAFNAYMKFDGINASADPYVDVRFYQYYRKFNNDHCWLDYSSDNGATWQTVEFNLRGIDVAVNGGIRGNKRVTVPTGNAANFQIRIRWSVASDQNGGGAYGYVWMIDDLFVIGTPAQRLTHIANEYFEGFYHILPQGLDLPLTWATTVSNTGCQAINNVTGSLYHMADRNTEATLMAERNIGTLQPGQDSTIIFDPTGWYSVNGFGFPVNAPEEIHPEGPRASLPTAQTGRHYVFGDFSATNWDHAYQLTTGGFITFDTMSYLVNAINENNTAIWARDNGVLTCNNEWVYGMTSPSTYTEDPEGCDGWHQAGYRVLLSYITGESVPNDWRIKGVQYVAATNPLCVSEGAVIYPELRKDEVTVEGTSMSVSFPEVETGADAYEITEDDLNTDEDFEVGVYGNDELPYNVITIEFPNQPMLEANSAYRLGYVNGTDDYFALASSNPAGYYGLDEEVHYFSETPGFEDFAATAGAPNVYNTIILDPAYSSPNGAWWRFLSWNSYPMIRMLVGPYEYKPKTNCEFQCGENGVIMNLNYNDLCGTTDSIVIGSRQTYLFVPDEGYIVDQIFVNGEVYFTNEATEEHDLYLEDVSESFPFTDENPVTISATFRPAPVGIDQVATNVKMNLMPNPATSNVRLSIEGVEGMVNLSIIDMSGRVISNTTINAEQTQNINLNSLAKGAYFVRVTNSSMTKVEKLIVR